MEQSEILSASQKDLFIQNGYLKIESLLSPGHRSKLCEQVDASRGKKSTIIEQEDLGLLITHPETMALLNELFETEYAFHHIHAARHDVGKAGVSWHQDYEQIPQTNRSHLMVHVFYYLNGLNGDIGDLLIVPGSQNTVCNTQTPSIFGTEDIPGSLVIDDLAPGSAVIVHSALWHCRRAKPGGEKLPRYFIDISYCEKGVSWPGYPNYEAINQRALSRGYDRDGRFLSVFDSDCFFDREEQWQRLANVNRGSLVMELS